MSNIEDNNKYLSEGDFYFGSNGEASAASIINVYNQGDDSSNSDDDSDFQYDGSSINSDDSSFSYLSNDIDDQYKDTLADELTGLR